MCRVCRGRTWQAVPSGGRASRSDGCGSRGRASGTAAGLVWLGTVPATRLPDFNQEPTAPFPPQDARVELNFH